MSKTEIKLEIFDPLREYFKCLYLHNDNLKNQCLKEMSSNPNFKASVANFAYKIREIDPTITCNSILGDLYKYENKEIDDKFKQDMNNKYGHIDDKVWSDLNNIIKSISDDNKNIEIKSNSDNNKNIKIKIKQYCDEKFYIPRPSSSTNSDIRDIVNNINIIESKNDSTNIDYIIYIKYFDQIPINLINNDYRINLKKDDEGKPLILEALPEQYRETFNLAYSGDLDESSNPADSQEIDAVIDAVKNDVKIEFGPDDIKYVLSNIQKDSNGYNFDKYFKPTNNEYDAKIDINITPENLIDNGIVINEWYRKKGNKFYKCNGRDGNKCNSYVSVENLTSNEYFNKSLSSVCPMFNTGEECKQFLNSILKDKSYSEIIKLLNDSDVDDKLNKLKQNINDVNPLIVISILKELRFKKKVVNDKFYNYIYYIEDVDHWMENSNHDILKKDNKVNKDKLKKFLSLLVNFINLNPTILNPSSKDPIYKEPIKNTYTPYVENNYSVSQSFINKGIPKYVPKSVKINSEKDWDNLKRETNKVWGSWHKGINFRSLNTLPREISPNNIIPWIRSIVLGFNPSNVSTLPLTGVYYGGDANFNKKVEEMLVTSRKTQPRFISTTVLSLIDTLNNKLANKNKELDEKTRENLINEIDKLLKLEKELYDTIELIQKYIRFIEMYGDIEEKSANLALNKIKELVDEYEKNESILVKKNDKLDSIANAIFTGVVGDNSGTVYTDL